MHSCMEKHVIISKITHYLIQYFQLLYTEERAFGVWTDLAFTPCCRACWAMLAERDISSYELLVQLPISAGGAEQT